MNSEKLIGKINIPKIDKEAPPVRTGVFVRNDGKEILLTDFNLNPNSLKPISNGGSKARKSEDRISCAGSATICC